MKTSGQISTKQERLIVLLLTERTIDAACQKAKVAVTTYWRWMKDEKFLDQYRKVRRGIIENTVAKLQSMAGDALDTLERNLTCENPGSEIRSAQIILDQGLRGAELLDIENRIEYLEANFNRREGMS